MMNTRNNYFDQVKGTLILLVVIGHVALGSLDDNLLRHIIYFFHMPLFLGITGYFVSRKTIDLSILGIIKKYAFRLLIPFLIAFVIYTNKNIFNLNYYLYPYYHLWYVPAMIVFIFYTKLVCDLFARFRYVLSIPITAIFIALTIFFESFSQWDLYNSQIYNILGDKRFYYFFSYFFVGYLLSIKKVNIHKSLAAFILLSSITLYLFAHHPILIGGAKTIFNIVIIYLVISYCTAQHSTAQHSTAQHSTAQHSTILKCLSSIGKVSLPIYLWHVIPIMLLKKFIILPIYYYSLSFLVLATFIFILIKLDGYNKYLDLILYGKQNEKFNH